MLMADNASSKEPSNDLLSVFTSNWFVIVMGLGGLINVIANLWGTQTALASWIQAGVWANSSIFAILLSIWIARWFLTPRLMWDEITHPALSHFFGLIPVALAILGLNWSLMGAVFSPSVLHHIINVVWIVSVVLGLLFSIIITDSLVRQDDVDAQSISFSWLIGSVANALFPLLGSLIVSDQAAQFLAWSRFVDVADVALFGIGLSLFFFLTAFLFGRYFTAPEPPAEFAPVSWLLLGAAAVLSLGVIGIANSSVRLGLIPSTSFSLLASFALWGLAGWSFLLVLTMTLRVWFAGELHFTLAWWAFVFPLSAYVLDARTLAGASHVHWLNGYSDAFVVLLFVFFLIVLVETLIQLLTGRLFRRVDPRAGMRSVPSTPAL